MRMHSILLSSTFWTSSEIRYLQWIRPVNASLFYSLGANISAEELNIDEELNIRRTKYNWDTNQPYLYYWFYFIQATTQVK